MKGALSFLFALVTLVGLAQSAEAQWIRTYHAPVVVSPQPVFVAPQPVMVAPQPVTVFRPPVVMYQPTTVVTTRHRPILGGTVVRTRPGYRRVIY
ncbi:MAG: hypothetical protein AB7G28_26025 [Pirellulales bacterium]